MKRRPGHFHGRQLEYLILPDDGHWPYFQGAFGSRKIQLCVMAVVGLCMHVHAYMSFVSCGYGIITEEATAEEGTMAPYHKVNTVLLFLLSL